MTNVKRLQLISLLSGMLFYTPVMTLFLLQRDISLEFLLAAQTVFSVAMMAGELPTGLLADKFGQKVSIALGLLLDAFGMVQLLLVHNEAALLAYFAVRGLSVALRSGSDEALLYDSYVAERKHAKGYSKAYGTMLSNDILGFVLATAVAGIGLQLYGPSAYTPMIAITGLFVSLAFLLALTLKPYNHENGPNRINPFAHLKGSLKLVRSNRTIFALLLAGLLTLNGEYFLRQSYQPYFQDMQVPALFLGAALAAGKLLNYFVVRYSHLLENYLSVDQIILWIHVALGGLFVLFTLAQSPWALVAIFVLIQGLLNAERPVVSDYINQRVESFQRSTVLSAVSFAQNLAQIFARLALAGAVGLIGLRITYALQGMYLLIGVSVAVWYLRKCGCVHRVTHTADAHEAEAAQELA